MSSMMLFNKNYAKQNLKKSKGILAIMLIIIPIITLFVLYNYDNTSYLNPYDMAYLTTPNLIGMFIIPFIVSNILLGYVYKRNSIDFINSMPITRKKIYLTNIITGILYLILLQIINFIIVSSYVLIAQNTFVSMQMVIDNFIVMTISYCFMFALSSLALSVSGNRFTQIVIAMLILFLIPFIRVVNLKTVFTKTAEIINNNGDSSVIGIHQDSIFSLPINICCSFAIGRSIYNISSMIYTLILGLIYIGIGTKLFEKRKMEDTGYSFASSKVHLFVKALTLYPMVVFAKYIYRISRIPEVILIVFLIFVYYFIYDLITKKKIKLKITVISFISFFIVLVGIVRGIEFINQKFLSKDIKVNIADVKELTLEMNSFEYHYDDNIDIVVENQEIVNYIFDNIINSNSEYYASIKVGLKLKNNRTVQIPVNIDEKTYIELLEKIYNEENYIKALAEKYRIENEAVISFSNRESNINLKNEKEIKRLINESLEDAIKFKIKYLIEFHTTYKDSDIKYVKSTNYYSRNFISLYLYKNHSDVYYRLELDNLPELETIVARKVNEKTKDDILRKSKLIDNTYSLNFSVARYISNFDSAQTNIWLTREDYKKVLNFLVENYDKEFDPRKDYYEIRCYDFDLVFYTNDIEGFNRLVEDKLNFREDVEINTFNKSESAEAYVDDIVNNF